MARHETPYAGAWDTMIDSLGLEVQEHDVTDSIGWTLDVEQDKYGRLWVRAADELEHTVGVELTPQDAHRIARKLDALAWAIEAARNPYKDLED